MTPPPSRKLTLPVSVPAPGARAVTVAENVTCCPKYEGLTLEATTVAVLARVIVSWRLAEELDVKLGSPL